MTTDQELPPDGQSTTALFTAKGIDVTPNKDQGVTKVLFSQTLKCSFLKKASKLLLKWTLVATDCEASRTRWRPTNDRRQSDRPLYWEAVEQEEV